MAVAQTEADAAIGPRGGELVGIAEVVQRTGADFRDRQRGRHGHAVLPNRLAGDGIFDQFVAQKNDEVGVQRGAQMLDVDDCLFIVRAADDLLEALRVIPSEPASPTEQGDHHNDDQNRITGVELEFQGEGLVIRGQGDTPMRTKLYNCNLIDESGHCCN